MTDDIQTPRGAPPIQQPLIPGKVTSANAKISKKPGLAIAAVLIIVVVGTLATQAFSPKPAPRNLNDSQIAYSGRTNGEAEVLANAPQAGMIGEPTGLPQEDKLVAPITQDATVTQNTAPSPYEQMQWQMWQRQQQDAMQAEKARQEELENAHDSKTTVFSSSEARGRSEAGEQDSQSILGLPNAGNALRARASYQGQNSSNYLLSTRVNALSPNEIKAGTIIPATLIAGINSDLPGDIIAQVSTNVFDTATGRLLLIPQGARLFGRYDHKVVLGQKRVLIEWNRVIYPDASSLDIEGMAGHDEAGYSGFKDKADHHTWSVFNRALLMSAITAGAQLSQPRARSGDYSYSSQQILAASLGMNLNQLSMLTMQNRMNIAPTVVIRPGYRFNVMVNKDIILPVWESVSNGDDQQYTVSR